MKQLRQTSIKYRMIEDGDHIMCAVSGGKDSATMLHLLLNLQKKLKNANIKFEVTAVHLNQMQPGYDGKPLVSWLDGLVKEGSLKEYKIITEDTYSIVIDKTAENKTYCSMCSRLRRGILYSIAHDIKANKIALGHHGDDAIETLLLNFIHAGQMKSMPARYYSSDRDIHVIRPLISSLEEDIAHFARVKDFPILPCNLCGTQPDAQRAKVKLLVDSTLTMFNPNAKKNMINAMGDVRPSHLLDIGLREACGFDGATGEILDGDRVKGIRGYEESTESAIGNGNDNDNASANEDGDNTLEFGSKSRIESLL
jgi:tRNA 2-thiocytidine biosynthesis protein TtcA